MTFTDSIREIINTREERLLAEDAKAVAALSAADDAQQRWQTDAPTLLLKERLDDTDHTTRIKLELAAKLEAAADAERLLEAINAELQHIERGRKALSNFDLTVTVIARLQEHPYIMKPLIHTEQFTRYKKEIRNARHQLDGLVRLLPDDAISELVDKERATLDGFDKHIADLIAGYEQRAASIPNWGMSG